MQSELSSASPLFFVVPQTKQYAPYGGKYLFCVLMEDYGAIEKFRKFHYFDEEIEAIFAVTDKPESSCICPVCRKRPVTHFIQPDLNNYSICFRRMVCNHPVCQKKALETFQVKAEDLRPFSLRTALSSVEENERRILMKCFREVMKIPKIGGGQLINWCVKEIFAEEMSEVEC